MTPRSPYLGSALALALIGAALCLPAARADPTPWALNATLTELLSGIDFVPSRTNFDAAAVTNDDLIAIARDPEADAGQRIRAYRALSHYPGAGSEKALTDAIAEHKVATTGVDTIYLRAAMESLALVAGEAGVPYIAPLLTHDSRDVRAACADALAICGSTSVIPQLRERVNDPTEVAQVKTACLDAIRVLTELL